MAARNPGGLVYLSRVLFGKIFASGTNGPGSPKIPDFRWNCACLHSQLFLVRNPEINMTSSATSLSSENDVEQQGVNFVLQVIGRENVTLKEKQM